MDHILQHESDPVPDLGSVSEQKSSRPSGADEMDVDADDEDIEALRQLGVNVPASSASAGVEAKVFSTAFTEACGLISFQSIKCSECGKIFKTTALANFHAEKSGHDQFEESTEEVCQTSQ